MSIIIFGATGGIGRALCRQSKERFPDRPLLAVSRNGTPVEDTIPLAADVTDSAQLASLADKLKDHAPISLCIIATGLLSDGGALRPEKSWRHLNIESMERLFRINTFAPALIAGHILPLMPTKSRSVLAALSARVGSISDNRLGGWHSYRASKAALNMMMKTIAIEQARRAPEQICVTLHPGTVDTPLSKSFQSNVPDKQLFTPDTSAKHLLNVIERLQPSDTGKTFDWAGKEIPA